ncbi:MAG: peptide ABC transporter ATP-binding protein, partial [Chitinispirillales bacterium]|nr:peptide ABC transporter ATP-binding protein [Chitinispirillales bacterium]
DAPRHPYTDCLLKTVPSIDKKSERLTVIPGNVPTPLEIPEGCAFHPRCPRAADRCKKESPPLHTVDGTDGGHQVRCHHYE